MMTIGQILLSIVALFSVIIALIVIVVGFGRVQFKRMTKAEMSTLSENNQPLEGVFSVENIQHLPPPVQRYLKRTILEGTPLIQTVHLRQRGTMRQSPESDWSPFEAEQTFTTCPPAFIWIARMKMLPFLHVAARDKYLMGQGEMLITLQSTVRIAKGRGTRYDSGAFIRFMAEMMWFPTAMLHEYVIWETLDDCTAVAVSQVGDEVVRVIFHFDEQDDIAYIESHDRHMGDDTETTPWLGYASQYQVFDGIRVPTQVEVGWKPESGYFPWWRATITEIEYNHPIR